MGGKRKGSKNLRIHQRGSIRDKHQTNLARLELNDNDDVAAAPPTAPDPPATPAPAAKAATVTPEENDHPKKRVKKEKIH